MMSLMLNTIRASRRMDAEAPVDLRRIRAWFTEESAPSAADEPQAEDGKPASEAPKRLEALPEEIRAYIRSLRKENEARRKRLAEFEKAQAEAELARRAEEEKRMAEQGQWQKLAEERAAELERLRQVEAQYSELIEAVRQRNVERINRLPETLRGLVPVDYEPLKLASWLDANEGKLVKPQAPNLNAGQQSTGDAKKAARDVIKRLSY